MEAQTEIIFPVYVVGDSHALPYRNLSFREPWTGRWVAVRSKYVSGLTAHDFFSPRTREFHHGLIEFFEYEGLVRDGRAVHVSTQEADFAIAAAAAQPVMSPLILFAIGDIDVRGVLMPLLADTHDFVPPFDTGLPLLDRPLVPWDFIEEAIDARISPFFAGLGELMACGFNRLYVQSVVPPTTNEARVRELHGWACPVSVRTKLAIAFNRKLAEGCSSIGATVLDLWPALTEAGLLRKALEVDGVHLPPSAARWFVDALLEDAINHQWLATNFVRYELFYRMACGLAPFAAGSFA